MAKTATKATETAAATKTTKAAAAAIRPVKETLTKAALIGHIAEQNELRAKPPLRFTLRWKLCFSAPCILAASANSPCRAS